MELCNIKDKCVESIHAEQNAIAYAAREGLALNNCIIYCTTAPCLNCAKLIVQCGITAVYYDENYSDDQGLLLLRRHNITCNEWKLKPTII